ncbi:MAG: hypothetical protein WDL87_07700 [Candidatus Omnitrophota bacterium]|jgi:hypothetical protein
MSKGKWGESFLKSGLPLEYLTLMTFRSLGWHCDTHIEYERKNREGNSSWFELDLMASYHKRNQDTELAFLVECKYHDLSRFWFFLPHIKSSWHFDDRVLNVGPLQTLAKPRNSTFLEFAPTSSGGIVVAENGSKQDNAVCTAIQQLTNSFVPICMSTMFNYNIDFYNVREGHDFQIYSTALIPMVVTNAKIYRLKSTVTDIDIIRKAASPKEIADEIPWTWCYFDLPMSQLNSNYVSINEHEKKEKELICRYAQIKNSLSRFENRPNWVLITSIINLQNVIETISNNFMKLPTIAINSVLRNHRR